MPDSGPSVPERQLADLGPLRKIGEGGQGTVYRLNDQPDQLLKRYTCDETPNVQALASFINWSQSLQRAERQWLSRRTALPEQLVWEADTCIGFTMRAAEPHFYCTIGGRPRLRELAFLTHPPRRAWSEVTLLTPQEKLTFLRRLLPVFAFLHKNRIVFGDISTSNVLWSPGPAPRVMLVDCDGMRLLGERAVLKVRDTPDWDDPAERQGPPSLDSDRYKVALLVLRVLLQIPKARPDAPDLPGLEHLPRRIRQFLSQSIDSGNRPAVEEWLQALDDRGRIAPSVLRGSSGRISAASR